MTPVCLSARPHVIFFDCSLLTDVTPVCSLLKMVYVAVILSLHGRLNKSNILWLVGDIYWKWMSIMLMYRFNVTRFLYVIQIHLSMFSIENSMCSCYTFFTGTNKEIRYITLNGRFLFKLWLSHVKCLTKRNLFILSKE